MPDCGKETSADEAAQADVSEPFETLRGSLSNEFENNAQQLSARNQENQCYSSAQKVKKTPVSSSDRVALQFKKLKRTLRKGYSVGEGSSKASTSNGCATTPQRHFYGRKGSLASDQGDLLSALTLSSEITSTQTAQLCSNVPYEENKIGASSASSSLSCVEEIEKSSLEKTNKLHSSSDYENSSRHIDDFVLPHESLVVDEPFNLTQCSNEEKPFFYMNMCELFEKPNVSLLSKIPPIIGSGECPSPRPGAGDRKSKSLF